MGEEDVAHIGNGILLIQSEVSQKEKQILYPNAYIWNFLKNGTDEPSGRAGIKTQT